MAGALLFSAYAEVFLSELPQKDALEAFLCLRRGVSSFHRLPLLRTLFSLPTQRCFHPPYERGLVARAFLCLRRGVSWAEG